MNDVKESLITGLGKFTLHNPEMELKMDIKNRYGLPEQKGEPVRVKLAQGACIGTNELGENEAYFVLNGPPATFYCIDVETPHRQYPYEKQLQKVN